MKPINKTINAKNGIWVDCKGRKHRIKKMSADYLYNCIECLNDFMETWRENVYKANLKKLELMSEFSLLQGRVEK